MVTKKELMETYEQLSLGDKRKELGREIAEMTLVTQKLISDFNSQYKIKSMDEFVNLFEESTSEEKYLSGLYQDVVELEESISEYYNLISTLYYEDKI